MKPSLGLKTRYGGEWAIVTRASERIGKTFACKLTKQGFKVVLVARNQEKLDKIAQEIRRMHAVTIKIFVFEYDGLYT